ncbi:MAG: 7-cyano-7-deazaguanine synthase [Gammaproteobacteria bacterium]|nr:7-cyano-7-deazaguanine synthase [Gammaproteobacteria bacterium]
MNKHKALSLISGGLDSLLAAKVLMEQGLQLEGVHFDIGFNQNGTYGAEKVAAILGIKLHIVDVVDEFKQVMQKPKHGFGAHINPCLDCKIFMVKVALKWAQEHGFDFVATGEVVGQRPKSQRAETLPIVAQESGAYDLLLRPLCAKLLPPTKPEREGWVDRTKLLAISGRSRKEQLALAKKFGFTEHPSPAGGCLLTEEVFSRRMQDLWRHRKEVNYSRDDLALLRIGRHLRINDKCKIIVGRNHEDNLELEKYGKDHVYLITLSHPGPLVLIDGEVDASVLQTIASIAAHFSKGKFENQVILQVCNYPGMTEIRVRPMLHEECSQIIRHV